MVKFHFKFANIIQVLKNFRKNHFKDLKNKDVLSHIGNPFKPMLSYEN
jgi:hypothetical protein